MANSFLSGMAGGATVAIVIKAFDEYSKELNKASKDVSAFGKTGYKSLGLVAAAAVTVGVAMTKLAIAGAKAGDIQEQFNKVVGVKGTAALVALQKETLGTVSKTELMSATTAAVVRGLQVEYIPSLAKLSMQMKDAGIEVGGLQGVINDVTTAAATGRVAGLIPYGVDIDKLKKALENANSQGERAKIVIEALTEASKKMADPTADAADKVDRLAASWKNLKEAAGQTEVVSGSVSAIADTIQGTADAITAWSNIFKYGFSGASFEDGVLTLNIRTTEEVEKQANLAKDILWQYSSLNYLNQFRVSQEKTIASVKESVSLKELQSLDSEARLVDTAKKLLLVKYEEAFITKQMVDDVVSQLKTEEALNDALNKRVSIYDKLRASSSYLAGKSNQEIAAMRYGSGAPQGATKVSLPGGGYTYKPSGPSQVKRNDFIIRPGMGAMPFSPNDTIIGVKNPQKMGGGINVYIDSVQGLSADAVAEALQRKLSRALTI